VVAVGAIEMTLWDMTSLAFMIALHCLRQDSSLALRFVDARQFAGQDKRPRRIAPGPPWPNELQGEGTDFVRPLSAVEPIVRD
jgi:hypothetical protein